MKKNSQYFLILVFIISMFDLGQINAQIDRPVGTNLTGIVDYSSEFVFVDVFNQTREWIAHENVGGAPWSSGVHIPLGTNGYPLEVPYNDGVNPEQAIRTLMFFGELEGKYPSGKYRLIASGKGKIMLWGAASGTYNCPVDTYVDVDSDQGGIALEIEESLVTDPVHDIHFVMPGFGNTYDTEPYNPKLLQFIEDFQVIRYMDWMKTNGSHVTEWSDRNTKDYYSQTLNNGVALSHIIDLSNQTQKDAWICIPHRANDEYIKQMARIFRDGLDKELRLYIEYSNEVWNSQFSQSQFADSMGNALGYSGNPWEQGWKYYAKRTADIHQIFETEFGGNERLIKVISSQAANPWVTNYIIERYKETKFNPTQIKADAIATAPYFAGGVANNIANTGLANSISVDAILDSMELSMDETFSWMVETKTLADQHNLDFITYEGGQHLVTNWQHNNNEDFVNKLIQANQSPRMEDLYCQYFNYWYDDAQGGLFCNFSSHAFPSKYGSWGIKEHLDDTLAPKYLGMKECVFKYNTQVMTDNYNLYSKKSAFSLFPNPSNGQITIKHNIENPTVKITDNLGRPVCFEMVGGGKKEIKLKISNFLGIVTVTLQNDHVIISKMVYSNH